MILAAILGWAAGFVATLPIEFSQLAGVASGDERLLIDYLTYGLLVWALITVAISIASLVFAFGPFAALVGAQWTLRHSRLVTFMLPTVALIVTCYRAAKWNSVEPGPYIFRAQLHMDYSIFIFVFTGIVSWMYVRLLRREIRRVEAAEVPQREG